MLIAMTWIAIMHNFVIQHSDKLQCNIGLHLSVIEFFHIAVVFLIRSTLRLLTNNNAVTCESIQVLSNS